MISRPYLEDTAATIFKKSFQLQNGENELHTPLKWSYHHHLFNSQELVKDTI